MSRMGIGNHGDTHHGLWRNEPVALKKLSMFLNIKFFTFFKTNFFFSKEFQQFAKEFLQTFAQTVKTLCLLEHRNLQVVCGALIDADICVVST